MERSSQKVDYQFYPSILDAYQNYIDSDMIWERYWGFSENPQHTPEEFHEIQREELINRINRVPVDSEAADRGTAFNNLVDFLAGLRDGEGIEDYKGSYKVTVGNRHFYFNTQPAANVSKLILPSIEQEPVEGVLDTVHGKIRLYGYPDYIMPDKVVDLKTTGRYWYGKYKHGWQHIVYPWCLRQMGNDIDKFEYVIVEFDRNGIATVHHEIYNYRPEMDEQLKEVCSDFISFLTNLDNREKITDKKIFGEDGQAD